MTSEPTRIPIEAEATEQANNKVQRDEKGRLLPGASLNPGGRPPRKWTWKQLLEEAFEEEDETGQPAKQIAVRKLVQKTKEGDVLAFREAMDRMDGKATQGVDVTSAGKEVGTVDAMIAAMEASRSARE